MKQIKPSKDKLMIIVLLVVLALVSLNYWNYYATIISDRGAIYPSRRVLCDHLAQSYLETVKKEEHVQDFQGKTWEMAVDVETDLYRLCMTQLTQKSLSSYALSGLKKYSER